jgi:N-acetylneuraminic acid mutarotase
MPGFQCARRLHEMAAIDDKLYIVGGIGSHSFHQQTQIPIECYNTLNKQWTMLTSTLAGRSIGHFIEYGGHILSIGREHYEATEDDLWIYNVTTDTWSHKTKAPRRTGLASAFCAMLHLNFFDEKIAKCVLSDKR